MFVCFVQSKGHKHELIRHGYLFSVFNTKRYLFRFFKKVTAFCHKFECMYGKKPYLRSYGFLP